jgi:hypothetical protein
MFGMHREEMLARLANHDLPLHYIELDAMQMFALMILKHPTAGRKVKYFRMCTGAARFRTYILVAQYTVTIADDLGRIVQVRTCRSRRLHSSIFSSLLRTTRGPSGTAATAKRMQRARARGVVWGRAPPQQAWRS